MTLPYDFDTCSTGSRRVLSENEVRISDLENDKRILMEMCGVSEEQLKEMRAADGSCRVETRADD